MNNLTKLTLTLLAAASPMLLGQTAASGNTGARRAQQTAQQQIQPQAQTPEYDRGVVLSKIFTIKYRDPVEISRILKGLGSGHAGALIEAHEMQDIKTITVRDYAQHVAAIENAIRVLDVPVVKQDVDLQLRIDIIWASNKEISGNPVSPFLSDVIPTLSKSLNYKFFREAGTIIMRSNGKRDLINVANISHPTSNAFLQFTCNMLRIEFDDKTGVLSSMLSLTCNNARINSDIKFSGSEKMVVGTTFITGNIAMIAVLSMEKVR